MQYLSAEEVVIPKTSSQRCLVDESFILSDFTKGFFSCFILYQPAFFLYSSTVAKGSLLWAMAVIIYYPHVGEYGVHMTKILTLLHVSRTPFSLSSPA
jgi:hypothetical protein